MLHVAIQGYFREWFVQTAQYKQITDLVKIMDHEFWKHTLLIFISSKGTI